jgi:two-component system response regulator MprA
MVDPPHILIVDDDRSMLRTIQLSLVTDGFVTETASDGVQALELVESQDFDAVVLDLLMPRMDGRSFYRELRRRGHTMPVLILSAYNPDDALKELQAQAALRKPFDPDFLVEVVRSLLPAEVSRNGTSVDLSPA